MKKIFLICAVLVAVAGCKRDPLDITPDGRVTLSDIFKDNDQTGAYLNSCYGYIQPEGIAYYWWSFLEGFTTDAHNNDDPTENLNITDWYHGGLTPSHNPMDGGSGWNTSYYTKAWQGIRATNVFLTNIDNANVTSAVDKARWKAEAHILRAYYYWELIRMYGGMPIEDKPFPVIFDYKTLTRSTFDSCVQFIVADCEAGIAEPQMPWRITTGNSDRGRMTKAVAYAIESEATLFNASPLWNSSNDQSKWKQAATVSQTALTAMLANGYALYGDYGSYFLSTPDLGQNPSDKETIFEIKNSSGMTTVQNTNGIPSNNCYKAGCSPSQELVDAYGMKNGDMAITGYQDDQDLEPIINPGSGYSDANPYANRDPRFYATVLYNGAHYGVIGGVDHTMQCYVGGSDGLNAANRQYTHNGYYLRKFIDTTLTPSQTSGASWRKFRLAEIYLNLAEAENEANGPDQVAYNAVNAIRERAGIPDLPAGLSQDQFRVRVRNERRVELAFEGKRFWDVRRWKILGDVGKLSTGMKWTKSGSTLSGQRFVVDTRQTYEDKFLIFPISLSEISDLPGFTQNPGW